jgi:hypothetical protein
MATWFFSENDIGDSAATYKSNIRPLMEHTVYLYDRNGIKVLADAGGMGSARGDLRPIEKKVTWNMKSQVHLLLGALIR